MYLFNQGHFQVDKNFWNCRKNQNTYLIPSLQLCTSQLLLCYNQFRNHLQVSWTSQLGYQYYHRYAFFARIYQIFKFNLLIYDPLINALCIYSVKIYQFIYFSATCWIDIRFYKQIFTDLIFQSCELLEQFYFMQQLINYFICTILFLGFIYLWGQMWYRISRTPVRDMQNKNFTDCYLSIIHCFELLNE